MVSLTVALAVQVKEVNQNVSAAKYQNNHFDVLDSQNVAVAAALMGRQAVGGDIGSHSSPALSTLSLATAGFRQGESVAIFQ